MDQTETGNNSNKSNQDPNLDLESEMTNKLQISNEKPGSSLSTAVKKCDSGSDVNGEDQNGKNPSLVEDDNKSSISNEMNEQEEEDEMDSEDILFNLTAEEKFLAQKIFLNHLTLRKILDNSSLQNNFDFRLVNKLWEKEATSVIMKVSVNQLYLQYKRDQEVYEVSMGGESSKILLSELNSCISSSRRFPCSNFWIWYSKNFENEDMAKFLRVHGEEIKTLYFRGSSSTSYVSSLRKLLLEQAPNIQNLKIYTNTNVPSEELLFRENVILPHLRCLHIFGRFSQILEIIWASPNLQEIDGDLFQAVDALISMGKINLVKELKINLEEAGSLDLLKKWAEAKPKLTSLELKTPIFNMGNSLSKILEANRESLVHMTLHLRENFFNGVVWPKFENVQKLSVSTGSETGDVQSFSPNFISDVFPNITELEISDGYWEQELLSRLLNTATQLPCLKTVYLWTQTPGLLLSSLVRAAPNVEEVNVKGIFDFSESVGLIWGFLKLKKLTLECGLCDEFLGNNFPQLDMGITGLPEEMVRKLHEDLVYFEEKKGQEIPRVTPSILDCKALETLTLSLSFAELHGGAAGEHPTFTAVSGEFGFKLMSQVKVKLICRDQVSFSPLAPYVNM